MENTVVVGFDVRVPLSRQCWFWNYERRASYLIRPEILLPISVDRGVWPSFESSPNEQYPLALWGSIADIVNAVPSALTSRSDAPVIIEIAVVATNEESSSYWEGIVYGPTGSQGDRKRALASESLGYDVADRFFISGLCNCQLSPTELAAVRKEWSQAINPLGLFGEAEVAKSFRSICDRFVPEHAPFEVCRIRRIGPSSLGSILAAGCPISPKPPGASSGS
jgi:hypothetical protein